MSNNIKKRTVHMAEKVNANGDVSAFCYKKPRAIDLHKASWTLDKKFVTCRKCRALLNGR